MLQLNNAPNHGSNRIWWLASIFKQSNISQISNVIMGKYTLLASSMGVKMMPYLQRGGTNEITYAQSMNAKEVIRSKQVGYYVLATMSS